MKIPQELFYTQSHEWAKNLTGKVRVGITDYAQKEISDIVFIELPKVGQAVEQGKSVAVIESVKAAFDIYAPVSGKISAINSDLESNPAQINDDCYGAGWLFEIEGKAATEASGLLSPEKYTAHLKQDAKS